MGQGDNGDALKANIQFMMSYFGDELEGNTVFIYPKRLFNNIGQENKWRDLNTSRGLVRNLGWSTPQIEGFYMMDYLRTPCV